jgi:hypothetical protein
LLIHSCDERNAEMAQSGAAFSLPDSTVLNLLGDVMGPGPGRSRHLAHWESDGAISAPWNRDGRNCEEPNRAPGATFG